HPSFIPPQPIRVLRDLPRYRKSLVEQRTQEINRLHKVLEGNLATSCLTYTCRIPCTKTPGEANARLGCWKASDGHITKRGILCPRVACITGLAPWLLVYVGAQIMR